jgi:hypothetical protein
MYIGKGGHVGPELSVNQQKSVVMQRAVLNGQMLRKKIKKCRKEIYNFVT